MNASQAVQSYIKSKESLRFKAYPDPKTGGVPWTAGWGSTGHGIGPNTTLSEDEAEDYFMLDIQQAENNVNHYVHVPLTQGQYDALVSIFYNVGPGSATRDGIGRLKSGAPSTLIRKLNALDYVGARAEFPKWCSPGSNVENGLRIRRNEEVSKFWDYSTKENS
jgi:lysozyme